MVRYTECIPLTPFNTEHTVMPFRVSVLKPVIIFLPIGWNFSFLTSHHTSSSTCRYLISCFVFLRFSLETSKVKKDPSEKNLISQFGSNAKINQAKLQKDAVV